MDKTPEELCKEREQRFVDVVQLKVPDRVPISIPFSFFPAKYAGISVQDAYYDIKKWKKAFLKTVVDFAPDRCGLSVNQSGWVLEALDSKQTKWPGHGVSPKHTHQFVEGEYMTADEYDLFLDDTSDFLIRRYLPRVYGALEPFAKLPSLNAMFGMIPFDNLATPEFATLFETLLKAARKWLEWQEEIRAMAEELNKLGFPGRGMGVGAGAPFDMISDFLRGMRGTMLDMLRQPDKLLEAIDMLSRRQLKRIAEVPEAKEFSLSFIALHRGADGFMSNKQFEKFYWPTLKKSICALVDKGYTPNVFFEGEYTSRLEYLLELPKGKVVGLFDRSDMARVKEVLGGHICIAGNVPSSLLQAGSTQGVKDYCKWLIDVVGKDGGYIMAPGCSVDEVEPENLKAMIDFTKEYGIYS